MGVLIRTPHNNVAITARRQIERAPDGRLWALGSTGSVLEFWYSDNDGATWSKATGDIAGVSTDLASLFVDPDGNLFVAYRVAATGEMLVRHGFVSSATITWSAGAGVLSPQLLVNDIVAVRDPGGGWNAYTAGVTSDGAINPSHILRVTFPPGGSGAIPVSNQYYEFLQSAHSASIDFHHTGDGKTIKGGTPHLYMVWRDQFSNIRLQFNSSTGSGSIPSGSASLGTGSSARVIFDGTRVMVMIGQFDYVSLVERDAANTATIIRGNSPALGGGAQLVTPSMSYDRDGNVYVVGINSLNADVLRTKWTRATNTWDAGWTAVGIDASHVALRVGWAFSDWPTVEGVYHVSGGGLHYQEILIVNAIPSAPGVLTPADGSTQDVAANLPITWQFNDPDQGDAQSAYTVRRRIGAVAHTYWNGTTWAASESGATKIASSVTALTLAPGWGADGDSNHFYSVKTWDALDQLSPWSAEHRVIPSAQDVPTITDPTPDGVDVTTATYTVVWTVATQTKYRLRLVGDTAGTPNLGLVEYDSGIINSITSRSQALSLPTNSVRRQLELTTWNDEGLASTPVYRIIDVAFTPPGTPTVALSIVAVPGAIRVTIDNPGGGVTVGSNDLFRRVVGDTGNGIRVATGLAIDAVVADYAVASGVDYAYRAKAIATTGATAFSSWTA